MVAIVKITQFYKSPKQLCPKTASIIYIVSESPAELLFPLLALSPLHSLVRAALQTSGHFAQAPRRKDRRAVSLRGSFAGHGCDWPEVTWLEGVFRAVFGCY